MNDDPMDDVRPDGQLHDRFAAAAGPARESDTGDVRAIDALWATSRRRRRNRRLAAVAGSAAALLLVAGVAVAVAPDGGGGGPERVTSRSGGDEAACRAIHRVILPDVDPDDLDELSVAGGGADAADLPMLARTLASALADFDPMLIVHLDPEMDDAEVEARAESLRGEPGVEDVRVSSREDTLAAFEEMFADQPAMLDAVTADQLPLRLGVEVDAANRDRLVDLLDADLQVMAVGDGTTPLRYVLGAAAYLERKATDTGLPELRNDLASVEEPWAAELVGAIDALLAAPDPSSVVDDSIVTGAAVVRIAAGVQVALVGCPEPPEPTVASSTTDPTDPSSPLVGEAAACAAIERSFVSTSVGSDAPTLRAVFSMFDVRGVRIDLDPSLDEAGQAAFIAAVSARPDVEVVRAQTTQEAQDEFRTNGQMPPEGVDPETDEIVDSVVKGSMDLRVDPADQPVFLQWVADQPGDHHATVTDDIDQIGHPLELMTADDVADAATVLALVRADLERADLPWADDLLAILDEAEASDEPIVVDAVRWGAIDEAASEACSVP